MSHFKESAYTKMFLTAHVLSPIASYLLQRALCFSVFFTCSNPIQQPQFTFQLFKNWSNFWEWSNVLPYLFYVLPSSETVTSTLISPSSFLSFSFHLPTYYPLPIDFTTHLESYHCFPHLLLFLCCSLTILGSPSDSHTLWCSRGLPQVYSLWLPLLYPIWASGWGVGYRKGKHRCPASCCRSPRGSLDENAMVS